MSLEAALRDTIATESTRDDEFRRQMNGFREFEKQMHAGGYTIERGKFSIPLMDRVSSSYLYE